MKRVFLIGDSLRIGYCEHVAELLKGKAEVYWPNENCRFSHFILAALCQWVWAIPAEARNVDVVHWNCGQWDCAQFEKNGEPLVPVEEYADNLRRIHALIKRYFPHAKQVFALTTPVRDDVPLYAARKTADVIRYNEAAKRVMEELGVPVNDLFSVGKSIPEEQYADAVHLTADGYRVLAQTVADTLEKYI